MTIYSDTLTMPKPIFSIDSEKDPLTMDGFEIERSSFKRREEKVEKILMDYAPYSCWKYAYTQRKVKRIYFIHNL